MNEAKRGLGHGDFLRFLNDPGVGIEQRTADRMMGIAGQVDGSQLAKVGIAKATILREALSVDARQALIADRDIGQTGVRELRNRCNQGRMRALPGSPGDFR